MTSRTMPLRSVDAIDAIANLQFTNSKNGQFEQDSNSKKVISIFGSDNLSQAQNNVPAKEKESEVEVFVTEDRKFLDEYYNLRHFAYREENGWKNYDGAENQFDREGKIVVAVKDGKVIGGMRLMFSNESSYMSNEIPGTIYNYHDIMTKYDKRENLVFSEISAIVVAKGNRNRTITTKMFDVLLKESKKHNCNYMFGVAIALVCREYRMIFKSLGHDVEIVISYPWKQKDTYNFVRMFPMYTKFQ